MSNASLGRLIAKLGFYPTSLLLRLQLAATRSLLRGRFQWDALDRLGIPGHGTDLLRIDFPPARDGHPRWGNGRPFHPELAAFFNASNDEYLRWLRACMISAGDCRMWPAHENIAEPALPWHDNPFLCPADQAVLFGMLRHVQPDRYLEIGSGMSTRVAWQARQMGGFPMEIVSVDPEPRLSISALCDHVERRRLEDIEDFTKLVTPRTVVFFDGSHRSFPASDVTVFFLEILPRLPAGTLVHIHDIFLPADYPPSAFRCYWSEQYLLAAYLLGGANRVRVVLPAAYLAAQTEGYALLRTLLPEGFASGSSFWLQMV